MFKDFILDTEKTTNSKQVFFYKNSFKIKDLKRIFIYTGIWGGVKSSIPVENLSLDQYTKLSFALSSNEAGCTHLLPISNLYINNQLKNCLIKHVYKFTNGNYCDFELVPIDLIKQLFQEIYPNLLTDQKSGGICRKCGAYDEYAPIDSLDGKCFCYKCFK